MSHCDCCIRHFHRTPSYFSSGSYFCTLVLQQIYAPFTLQVLVRASAPVAPTLAAIAAPDGGPPSTRAQMVLMDEAKRTPRSSGEGSGWPTGEEERSSKAAQQHPKQLQQQQQQQGARGGKNGVPATDKDGVRQRQDAWRPGGNRIVRKDRLGAPAGGARPGGGGAHPQHGSSSMSTLAAPVSSVAPNSPMNAGSAGPSPLRRHGGGGVGAGPALGGGLSTSSIVPHHVVNPYRWFTGPRLFPSVQVSLII